MAAGRGADASFRFSNACAMLLRRMERSMEDDRERLLEEFITTSWDALFSGPQTKLGVTDGGLCALFASGHPLLERTREAIEARAPDFVPTEEQAFETVLPELAERVDLEPASLRDLGREYLMRLGEVVGADLADEGLVDAYAGMLKDYVDREADHRVLGNTPSRPGA